MFFSLFSVPDTFIDQISVIKRDNKYSQMRRRWLILRDRRGFVEA